METEGGIPMISSPFPAKEAQSTTELDSNWKKSLSKAIRSVDALFERLKLPKSLLEQAENSAKLFPLMVSESYLSKMTVGDANDPLLRQILPLEEEQHFDPDFTKDAVGDLDAKRESGLIHKYEGRALLILAGACAVNCRYCFRRHFPYSEQPHSLSQWEPAFKQIENDSSIKEIIFSGGDPLLITDERLGEIMSRLESISHLKRIRIHSRLPIVLPNRITDRFLELFVRSRLSTFMVVHANHPNELVDDCATALRKLVTAGIPTLNQSVLLQGVNDSADILTELSESLIDLGVIPYYLHQLDRVEGATHFEVPELEGQHLIQEIQNRLPGYAVPRYAKVVPGDPSKTFL